MSQNQKPPNQIASYVAKHQVALGTLLAAYGAFFLASVVMGGWIPTDWGKDIFEVPLPAIVPLLPRSFISPFFFVTSLPALLSGAALLCHRCIHDLRNGLTQQSQYAALLLVVFGFSYVVIGAWPLQAVDDKLWDWKIQTMNYGAGFAWLLTGLSLIALAVGFTALLAHRRAYRRGQGERF